MSILGVIVRTAPAATATVRARLAACAGVDIAADPADGRLILLIEDTGEAAAAATLGEITTWKDVLNTSLVYEYSGPDAPAPQSASTGYADWRGGLARLAERAAPA